MEIYLSERERDKKEDCPTYWNFGDSGYYRNLLQTCDFCGLCYEGWRKVLLEILFCN